MTTLKIETYPRLITLGYTQADVDEIILKHGIAEIENIVIYKVPRPRLKCPDCKQLLPIHRQG